MIRFILIALLVVFAIRALARLVRGALEGAGYTKDPARPAVRLMRDPVCGMYVVPSDALVARRGSETKYFCSEKCRRQWQP
jgi:YHS domain-containing protein